MRFRRIRDGQMVPDSEACDANGTVRDGYAASVSYGQRVLGDGQYATFSMAFMDSVPPAGAAVASSLSDNDRASVVARAEMMHRMNNAYLGDRAPAFTDAMAQLAIRKTESDVARVHTNTAVFAGDAARLRTEADAAHAQMTENIRNAWRN